MNKLKDVARYVRSKNAGPFWVTIDIFCAEAEAFGRICAASSLSAASIASLYGVSQSAVKIFQHDALNVIKISFPRPIAQGSVRDADSHAGQYFVPLLEMVIDGEAT